MAIIRRVSPFGDLLSLRQAMDQLFEESFVKPGTWQLGDGQLVPIDVRDAGDEIVVQAGPEGIRFLLVSGKPLEEPVAWYGPIVMNSQAELRQAMAELQNGTFIRHG